MKNLFSVIFIVVLFTVVGCGGGGSGGSSAAAQFIGRFFVEVSETSDPCGIESSPNHSFLHDVNQDGDLIALTSGEIHYSGQVNAAQTGFTVNATVATSGNCTSTLSTTYSPPSGDNIFDVVNTTAIDCGRGVCTVTYSGEANYFGGNP